MSVLERSETDVAEAPVLERRSANGDVLGRVALDPSIFAVPVNVPLLHQVVNAQLAARRSGTQSTRTRAEVRGGSSKPYRQKGTGNARQGSIRAPHYAGGGVALGPKPRRYNERTPKKMVQAALRCALSDRARTGGLRLVDELTFEVPKTKAAAAVLEALECTGKVLVVLGRDEDLALRSFANLPYAATLPADQLTAYDVLACDTLVFSDATLPGETSVLETAPAPEGAAGPAAASASPAASEPDEDAGGEETGAGEETATASALDEAPATPAATAPESGDVTDEGDETDETDETEEER